jgi:hypothetical protein
MISSKVLSIGLLLVSPIALARVQLSSNIEVQFPQENIKRFLATEIKLDTNETAVICDSNGLLVEMSALSEQQDQAVVQYSVFLENVKGEYELVTEPVLRVSYGEMATVSLGQNVDGVQTDSITIKLMATKIS